MAITAALKKEVETLAPSSFALVMSTGIISIGCHLLQFEKVSQILLMLNIVLFAALLLLTFFRLFLFFPDVKQDVCSHAKGPGFLTIVAGSGILGVQFVLLKQNFNLGLLLWFFALPMWLIIMYSFFISVITKKEKPDLEKGMNGSWLLVTVATESISVLTSNLHGHLPFPDDVAAFISLSAFLLGFILYVIIITIIFYRLLFVRLTAAEFTPAYWIDMGACAITTLAAATFISVNKNNLLFADLLPFLKTSAVLCWSVSTWWIPIIFILELWKHVSGKVAIKYNAGYWSLVFPLGMYTVCTLKISEVLQFAFLQAIAKTFIYMALFGWIITFGGMCVSVIKSTVLGEASDS
jgi:tellurite resistance protein TehA-like permease